MLVACALRMAVAHLPGTADSILSTKMAVAHLVQRGVTSAYENAPTPETLLPAGQYLLAWIGQLYQRLMSPGLHTASKRLDLLLKIPAITLDMLCVVVVVAYGMRQERVRSAMWAGGLYAFSPGIFYVTTYQGHFGEPLLSLCIAVAMAGLLSGAATRTGIFSALSIFSIPQALAFFPFISLNSLRHLRGNKPIRALAFGLAVSVILIAPFLIGGTVDNLAQAFSIQTDQPAPITAGALNIWWLKGWRTAGGVMDTDTLFGPVSYRTMGRFLFAVAYGLVIWRSWWVKRIGDLALLAGYVGLAFYMLPTGIDVNALFPIFVLLALATVHARRAWVVGGILMVTWTANLLALDPAPPRPILSLWPQLVEVRFPVMATTAALNVLLLLVWSSWLLRMGRPKDMFRSDQGLY